MGSWTELDAIYPPGRLSPAAVLVTALGHLAGARSAYVNGQVAPFWPEGLASDRELRDRVERYLGEVSCTQFLAEARQLLSLHQKHLVAAALRQAAQANGAQAALVAQLISGFGLDPAQPDPSPEVLQRGWEAFAQ
ncbi:MAG: hypothetical protein EOM24_17015 [Chloroflexia bacterium]|nr:hypothetical protein [Chloroflexia bacterium]